MERLSEFADELEIVNKVNEIIDFLNSGKVKSDKFSVKEYFSSNEARILERLKVNPAAVEVLHLIQDDDLQAFLDLSTAKKDEVIMRANVLIERNKLNI